MGYDWYNFRALCSSDNAIMVTNKDIKATRCPAGSSKDDVKEKSHTSSREEQEDEDEDKDEDKDLFNDPLDKDDVEWLLDVAPGYNAYLIGESFVLFTKGHSDIRKTPSVSVPGDYVIEDRFMLVR